MNAHLTLRKMSNRTSSGGRNVKLLQDMCLDTLSVRAVLDCFCNISLPPRLADYYYERVRKQHGITDEVLPVVFHSGSLQADLAGNPITGRGLTHLRKCVKLKKLTLSSNPADAFDENSLLETLKCFHELEEVQLTGLRGVTPDVVSVIAEQNKNLTTLRLDKCPNVDDACLRALGEGCPSLKHVSFSSTQITPCGVRALLEGACRFTLQEFLINGCCNLNSDAVSVLVAGCPSLRILGADSLSGIETALGNMRQRQQLTWFISS